MVSIEADRNLCRKLYSQPVWFHNICYQLHGWCYLGWSKDWPIRSKKEYLVYTFELDMLRFYDVPGRKYHGVKHILDLMLLFRTNDQHNLGLPMIPTPNDVEKRNRKGLCRLVHNVTSVEHMIYAHDVVYDADRPDNEDRSAAVYENYMEEYVESGLVEQSAVDVVSLGIQLSKGHYIPPHMWDDLPKSTNDIAVFLSMDLAQLASSVEVFNKNSEDVLFEYLPFYTQEQCLAGRKKFFEGMLDKPVIYPHPTFEQHWGDRARANIEQGLKLLG